MRKVVVEGFWDEEANVWVVSSSNVPGLATEGKTLHALVEKLKVMIPELLDANGYSDGEDVPFELHTQIKAIAHRRAATA